MEGLPLRRNLQALLLFRLLLAIFFLVLTLLFQGRGETDILAAHLQPLYFFCCALFIFTIIAGLSLKHARNLKRFAYIQLLFDTGAVTFLIFISGGVDSYFSFLYLPVIISSSMMLLRNGGWWIASACALSYGVLLDLQYFGVISPLLLVPDRIIVLKTLKGSSFFFHGLLMNIAVFYLVAYLSGHLAEGFYRSSLALRKQKKDLDHLEVLHQNIVQSISSGLLTIDTGLRVLFFNRAVEEILGLSADRIKGRNLEEILPDLDLGNGFEETPDGLRQKYLNRMEFFYRHPSGETLTLGYSVSSLDDGEGRSFGWIVIFQDLTRLKEMERHMRRMEQLAFAGKIAAEIAHEIKNPLAAISGSIQMLQGDLSGNSFHCRLLDIVCREIHRINGLVGDFLWLSKGLQKPENPEPVAVCGVIQDILVLLKAQGVIGSSHSVQTLFLVEPVLMMDPHRFRQVLWNVIENALEAMPGQGSLSIRVCCSSGEGHDCDGPEVRIDVEDTGEGIDPDVRARIFEPFVTTKEKGMGLGLSIVYELVKNAGGRISLDRGRTGGTLFSIFFPFSSSNPLAKTK